MQRCSADPSSIQALAIGEGAAWLQREAPAARSSMQLMVNCLAGSFGVRMPPWKDINHG